MRMEKSDDQKHDPIDGGLMLMNMLVQSVRHHQLNKFKLCNCMDSGDIQSPKPIPSSNKQLRSESLGLEMCDAMCYFIRFRV